MNIEYCPKCFHKLAPSDADGLCPHCGFDLSASTQPEAALPWGTRLHYRYIIGQVLGEGGFGITYLGYDTNLQFKVAIKEYFPRGVVYRDGAQSSSLTWPSSAIRNQSKDSGCERFLSEARKMARIGSIPNIVRVIDTFMENDTSYIIMEYVEGVTLQKYIQANGPMTLQGCLDLLRPLCASIDSMHKMGMYHRDISPDNIIISRKNKTAWLLDFGSVKDAGAGGESSVVIAKRGYSPTEQYAGKNIGPWTDVYAMCATIYYCVTGRTLPDANERLGDPSISWVPTAVPEKVQKTMEHGLSLQYTTRIQSMDELMGELADDTKAESVVHTEQTSKVDTNQTNDGTVLVSKITNDTTVSEVVDPPIRTQQKKNKILKIAIGAVAAVALIVVAFIAGTHFIGNNSNNNNMASEESAAPTEQATENAATTSEPAADPTQDTPEATQQAAQETEPQPEETPEPSDPPAPPEPTPEATLEPTPTPTPPPPTPAPEETVTNKQFTNALGRTYTYTGDVSNGLPNGTGTGVFEAWGDHPAQTYTGTWKDGSEDGNGTLELANGNKYVGELKEGKLNGQGTFTWAGGSTYVGEFKDGLRDGHGTLTYASGNKYAGEYKNNLMDGQGTYTWADGSTYVGEFKDDKKDGQGTMTYASGSKYIGEFKDGLMDGQGTYTWADGRTYVGEFKGDKKNGQGTLSYDNGCKFVGEFKEDQYNGQGTFTWSNGNYYIGEWLDGKQNGQGTQYNADGSIALSGTWKDGKFVDSDS